MGIYVQARGRRRSLIAISPVLLANPSYFQVLVLGERGIPETLLHLLNLVKVRPVYSPIQKDTCKAIQRFCILDWALDPRRHMLTPKPKKAGCQT